VPRASVVVVASLNVDLTATASRIPEVGETIIGTGFATSRGGKGGNQAVALARLGVGTTVIGCVGDDEAGHSYREALEEEGLSTAHVRSVRGEPTGTALITVSAAGDNNIVVVPGANSRLGIADVDAAVDQLAGATVVLGQLEVPVEATNRAFVVGRRAGSITVLNPAPVGPDLTAILRHTDVLVPNEVEFAQLTGSIGSDDGALRYACGPLFEHGLRWIVVTLGEHGVALVGPDSLTRMPALPVDAVDTTAAGDSFVAGLVSMLAERGDLERETLLLACEQGTRVAALTVQRPGAQPSLPRAEEVHAALALP
jgi:ribokinase